MDRARARVSAIVAVSGWAATIGLLAMTVATHARIERLGGADLATDPAEGIVYSAAMVGAASVGLVVAVRRRRHPVGWLFLALGVALGIGGAGDAWALERLVVDPGTVPSTLDRLALVAGQASFIAWFGLLAAVLHLTPTGRTIGRRWQRLLMVTEVAAFLGLAAKAMQDTPFDPPFTGISNPWAIAGLQPVVNVAAGLGITLTMLGLLVAGGSLVVRFRRAVGEERRQLRWMALVVVPLPVLVVASAVASALDAPVVRTIATGGFVAVIPVAAGLSVLRFRLYDVDRIVSRATAYALSSLASAGLFAAVGIVVGAIVGGEDRPAIPAVAATAVTVMAAAPLHRQLQDVVDRRFDRRRHDARRILAAHLAGDDADPSLEAAVGRALKDPEASLAYWLPAQERWATGDGQPAALEAGDIEAARDGVPVARVRTTGDPDLAATLLADALTELDNVRLRTEIATQLAEVRASRARIVAAQADERQRIERNLHDGAQQRLLGLAMHLRASQLADGGGADVFDHAVAELAAAVADLRMLAGGLRPSTLEAGGLAAALDDLAGRSPVPVDLAVDPIRLDPLIEDALWFVACEAMANTAKHSNATRTTIHVETGPATVTLRCADDGRGGADANRTGLRGISDRIEAIGGTLTITSPPGGGTTIEATVPCES